MRGPTLGDPSGTAGAARAVVVSLAVTGTLEVVVGAMLLVETFLLPDQVAMSQRDEVPPWLVVTLGGVAVFVVALVITGLLWLRWQLRTARLLWEEGATDITIPPGWGVAWWFIPYAQYVLPLIVVLQLDRAARRSISPPLEASTALVWIWWLLYQGSDLVAGLVASIAFTRLDQLSTRGPTMTDAEVAAFLGAFFAAFGAKFLLQGLSAIPAIRIVRRIRGALGTFALSHIPARPDRSAMMTP